MNDNLPSITIFDGSFDLSTIPRFPTTPGEKELREMTYRNFFECALDIIASGSSVASIIRNDPRGIDYGRFLRWVHRDKVRTQKYEMAQEIAAEVLVGEIPAIADGMEGERDMPMTTDRDNLRIRSRQWMAEKYNKRKYGQSKHIDVTSNQFDENAMKQLSIEELERLIAENDNDEEGEDE